MDGQISIAKRLSSIIVDFSFLMIIRIVIAIFGAIALEPSREKLLSDFIFSFGQVTPNLGNNDHLQFVLHSSFAIYIGIVCLLLMMVGIVYHCIMSASSWRASLGQRLCGFHLVSNNNHDVSMKVAIIRILLSYIPWLLIPIVILTWRDHLFISMSIALVLCFWHDTSIFTRKRYAIHDVITQTDFVYGKKDKKLIFFNDV